MSELSPRVSAILLAGGLGTRMGETEFSIPKYLREITDNQTLLRRHLDQLMESEVEEILILVGSRADQVDSYVKKTYPQPKKPIKLIRDSIYSGTAGAILGALSQFGETALVCFADTVHNLDLAKLLEFHRSHDADFTTVVHPNAHPDDSDLVSMSSDNKIARIFPKGTKRLTFMPNICMAAMFCVKRKWLEINLKPISFNKYSSDFVSDFLAKLEPGDHELFAYRTSEYISDAGTPERFSSLKSQYSRHLGLRDSLRPTVFLDRDGTINVEKGYLTSISQVELVPGVASFLRFLNEVGFLSICITNQPVVARGLISQSELQDIHTEIEAELARNGAYLDALYFCPHHPHSGFSGEIRDLKIECECRKPKTGLLELACFEHNSDKQASIFIGNSDVDFQTARNFGLPFFRIEQPNKLFGNSRSYVDQYEAIRLYIEENYIDY